MSPLVIAIEGPTAIGKSELAQSIAVSMDGEIIGADSMQIYKGMDIGTAKVLEGQRKVPHHLIDILDPGQSFSAQQYQCLARYCIADIQGREKVPILCGGTGLYVQAALEAFEFPGGYQDDNPLRLYYEDLASTEGKQAVWNCLHLVDPASADCIHPHNLKRVIRALEMHKQGVSYAEHSKNMRDLPEVIPSVRIGLACKPEILAARIDNRVDAMIEAGLIQEVENLMCYGFQEALTAPQAIGYKEIVAYLDGGYSLDVAIEHIKTATRRYAKRQRSWLRRDKRLVWIDTDSCNMDFLVSRIIAIYSKRVECLQNE